jgi:hypothetical protein
LLLKSENGYEKRNLTDFEQIREDTFMIGTVVGYEKNEQDYIFQNGGPFYGVGCANWRTGYLL